MLLFNTCNITKGRTFTKAQLELRNDVFFRLQIMNPTSEIAKTYRKLVEYQKQLNSYASKPLINLKSFEDLYGLLHFDLTNQEEEIRPGSTKLKLRFTLSAAPNAAYNIYASVLDEQELSVDVLNGKAVLKNK